MMLKDDKRSLATIIVKKMKDGEESFRDRPMSAGAEMAESEDLYTVADELMEAIKNSDIRALKNALESFVECCNNKEHNSMETSDEDSNY